MLPAFLIKLHQICPRNSFFDQCIQILTRLVFPFQNNTNINSTKTIIYIGRIELYCLTIIKFS